MTDSIEKEVYSRYQGLMWKGEAQREGYPEPTNRPILAHSWYNSGILAVYESIKKRDGITSEQIIDELEKYLVQNHPRFRAIKKS